MPCTRGSTCSGVPGMTISARRPARAKNASLGCTCGRIARCHSDGVRCVVHAMMLSVSMIVVTLNAGDAKMWKKPIV